MKKIIACILLCIFSYPLAHLLSMVYFYLNLSSSVSLLSAVISINSVALILAGYFIFNKNKEEKK